MTRIKPYLGTSNERLGNLIRRAQQPVMSSQVSFTYGTPLHVEGGEEGRTEVEVVAKYNRRTDAPTMVTYNRLSIDALNRLPAGELVPFDPMSFPTTTHGILPQINEAMGLSLVPDEVVDAPIPVIPPNGINLTITNQSLAWIPDDYLIYYAPHSIQPAGRGVNGAIPTDENNRIRVLEVPIPPAP